MKKEYYIIFNKKSKYIYGAFPRTKEGRAKAFLYRDRLRKKYKKLVFSIQ